MTTRARFWIAVLATVGLLAAIGSAYVHLQLLRDPGYSSFCDFSGRVSCTDVYRSRFGSLGGVPVAFGGVVWFIGTLLLLWADARGPRESRANVAAYMVVWSTIGLAVAMYMAYASLFVLRTFCVLCGVVYAAVIGIFLLSEAGSALPMRRVPMALVQDIGRLAGRPIGLAVTVLFLTSAAASVIWFPHRPGPVVPAADARGTSTDRAAEFDGWWAIQPRVESPVVASNGRIVVVKFTDYQCPACAQTDVLYEPIFAKFAVTHPGVVQLVTMDYPLDPECNEFTPNGPHQSACEAAAAVRLAGGVGSVEAARMQEWLYANQEAMTREAVIAALRDIAGVDNFDARYAATVEEVKSDIRAGAALPVEATPTFVINGVLVKGGLAPEFFERAIARELEP